MTDTKGHTDFEPGLRGHSVDLDTFPWRPVGGYWFDADKTRWDRWTVQGPDGKTYATFREHPDFDAAIDYAHIAARALKVQYPTGHISGANSCGFAALNDPGILRGCILLIEPYLPVQGFREHYLVRTASPEGFIHAEIVEPYARTPPCKSAQFYLRDIANVDRFRFRVLAAPSDADVVRQLIQAKKRLPI